MWKTIPIITLAAVYVFFGTALNEAFSPMFSQLAGVWASLEPATCMPDKCFCELVQHRIIRQPVNTWSNLGFVLAGMMTLTASSYDLISRKGHNLMRTQWVFPYLYGVIAVWIGIGSILFHSSLTFAGQVIDILSMYLLSSFMVIYNLRRAYGMSTRAFFGIYLVTNILLGFASILWPETRRYIFIGILAAILISELLACWRGKSKLDLRMLLVAFIGLAGSCVAWILDLTGRVCNPSSWLQLHSLWHLGMAVAVGFIYLYYRSERMERESTRG